MRFAGEATDDIPIRDARSARNVAGDKYPAFILSEYYEVEVDSSTNPLRKLRSAGKVWPLDVEADLSGKGTPNAFARTYSVDTREFTVESVLPPELLQHGKQLVVSVWAQDPEIQERALGAECDRYTR